MDLTDNLRSPARRTTEAVRILAVESTAQHLIVRDCDGVVHDPVGIGPDGPPPWELAAALLSPHMGDDPAVLVVAGTTIAPGSAAHFGWLRALQPTRLFVCRRSVHLLWRHPALDATAEQRLDAYADMTDSLCRLPDPDSRLRRIALREVTELDIDLAAAVTVPRGSR